MGTESLLKIALSSPLLARITLISQKAGIEPFLVGGAVRDMLLGREASDLDFVVARDSSLLARTISTSFKGTFIPLDEDRGIFRVVLEWEGEKKTLDFSTLSHSIEEDLLSRDLTLNALAVSFPEGTLFDPSGGLKDIERRMVRHIREESLTQDPLRLLRVFRFGATLEFEIHSRTLEAVRHHAPLITHSAGERIKDEFLKMLSARLASPYLYQMGETGLLEAILPELSPLKELPALGYHHLDGWRHSLETVHQLELLEEELWEGEPEVRSSLQLLLNSNGYNSYSTKSLLKFAALLHDMGKPACRKIEKDRESYVGHASHGAETLLPPIAKRLRLSGKEERFIALLIKEHLRLGFLANEEEPSRRSLYRYCRDLGEGTLHSVLLSLADRKASLGPLTSPEMMEKTFSTALLLAKTYLDQQNPLAHPKKLLSGHDLMVEFGLEPGPRLGILLKELEEAQAIHTLSTREEALAWMRDRLRREASEKC